MRRPFAHVCPPLSLKYDCLDYGVNQEVCRTYHEFHATDDVNPVRNAVFSAIKAHAFGCRVYSAALDKRALPTGSRAMVDVYVLLFGWLVHNVRVREEVRRGERVVAVTDVIKVKGKNEALRAALKRHMKRELYSGRPSENRVAPESGQSSDRWILDPPFASKTALVFEIRGTNSHTGDARLRVCAGRGLAFAAPCFSSRKNQTRGRFSK